MSEPFLVTAARGGRGPASRLAAPLARPALLAALRRLREGELTLVEGNRRWDLGSPSPDRLRATVTVRDPAFWPVVLLHGSSGAGDAWVRGWWTCDDLTAAVRILTRNAAVLESLRSGPARLAEPFRRAAHALRRNTPDGSRRNIADHYDFGNDFFRLFLDETMTYSCGVFEPPGISLREAQIAKLERTCRALELWPEHHLLEIGTGWGSCALHAASRHGCRVTTTTLSREQAAWARARVREAGLEGRVEVLERDYRELEGEYDRLISIEMIEAVGHEYYDDYFKACARLLRPDGAMLLQAIVIRDDLFEAARDTVDFIKRTVFPGSCIPSRAAIAESVARATDLRVARTDDITEHYPPTLRAWRDNLTARAGEARSLGFEDPVLRLWEFYFCYCEGGFAERRLGDVQLLLVKPGWRSGREGVRP